MSTSRNSCPPWCIEGATCRGEHASEIDYRPATGGLPRIDEDRGTRFPSVGVALSWDTIDHLRPCITVHTPGAGAQGGDAQFDLMPHEARQLIADLTERLSELEAAE